jgi:hypothetical protein
MYDFFFAELVVINSRKAKVNPNNKINADAMMRMVFFVFIIEWLDVGFKVN